MSDKEVIQEIEALETKRCKAILNCDYKALEALMAEDLRYVHSSAVMENKKQYLEKLGSGYYTYHGLDASDCEFRVLGDAVLVNGDMRITVEVAGTKKVIMSRYLQVWAKKAPGWQMVSWSSVPMAQ
jgi:ketosteroid isomerase-like protein